MQIADVEHDVQPFVFGQAKNPLMRLARTTRKDFSHLINQLEDVKVKQPVTLVGEGRRLHSLISDVESYSLQSGTQRVIGYLLRQDDAQAADSGATKLTLPVSKAIVASRLNLTPEHFSRVLHELAEQGLIGIDGRNIEIRDLDRLRTYGNC